MKFGKLIAAQVEDYENPSMALAIKLGVSQPRGKQLMVADQVSMLNGVKIARALGVTFAEMVAEWEADLPENLEDYIR